MKFGGRRFRQNIAEIYSPTFSPKSILSPKISVNNNLRAVHIYTNDYRNLQWITKTQRNSSAHPTFCRCGCGQGGMVPPCHNRRSVHVADADLPRSAHLAVACHRQGTLDPRRVGSKGSVGFATQADPPNNRTTTRPPYLLFRKRLLRGQAPAALAFRTLTLGLPATPPSLKLGLFFRPGSNGSGAAMTRRPS
jgi:hypothetical protein